MGDPPSLRPISIRLVGKCFSSASGQPAVADKTDRALWGCHPAQRGDIIWLTALKTQLMLQTRPQWEKTAAQPCRANPGCHWLPLACSELRMQSPPCPGVGWGWGWRKKNQGVQMPPPVAMQRSRETNTSRSGRQVTSGQFALKTGKGSPERISSVGGQMLSKTAPLCLSRDFQVLEAPGTVADSLLEPGAPIR